MTTLLRRPLSPGAMYRSSVTTPQTAATPGIRYAETVQREHPALRAAGWINGLINRKEHGPTEVLTVRSEPLANGNKIRRGRAGGAKHCMQWSRNPGHMRPVIYASVPRILGILGIPRAALNPRPGE